MAKLSACNVWRGNLCDPNIVELAIGVLPAATSKFSYNVS